MIFKDEVEIEIQAGKGGDGSSSFHREKFIPKGGPDGGDGGDGGSIIVVANNQLRTLSHIHNNQKFKARNGEDGMKNKKYGGKGESVTIAVPTGTVVVDCATGEVLADLTESEQEVIAAQGGRGGRGNVWFKSSTNQTPFYAEKGKPGVKRRIRLELKLIAHVGLVGFPNAGKSTLISRITNARPKIADYPFTTLEPNLGVLTVDDAFTSIIIADIPGIIEGAHGGKGLGIEFLKHIERTRIILYLIDIADQDPYSRYETLKQELSGYSQELGKRDSVVVLNKSDMLADKELTDEIMNEFREKEIEPSLISAITGQGLKELKVRVFHAYLEAEKAALEEEKNATEEN